jgi:hypothetical protein
MPRTKQRANKAIEAEEEEERAKSRGKISKVQLQLTKKDFPLIDFLPHSSTSFKGNKSKNYSAPSPPKKRKVAESDNDDEGRVTKMRKSQKPKEERFHPHQ